jgi:regulatory protein
VTPSTRDRPFDPYLPGDRPGGSSAQPCPDRDLDARPDARKAGDQEADQEGDQPADQPADQEGVARKILLDQLTGQARTRSELETRLARKGVPGPVAERLLDRFEEVGLVDDEAFARAWVQSRQSGKGLARRALAQELRRKGVSEDAARVALDEVDPDDEVETARRLVRRKLPTVARLGDEVAARRLIGLLARKGYAPGLCYRVVREELATAGLDAPEVHDGP